MTSALHAEGREFNPRPEYACVKDTFLCVLLEAAYTAGMAKWQGNRFVSGRSRVRSPLPAVLRGLQKLFAFSLVRLEGTVCRFCTRPVRGEVECMRDNMAEWLRR